MLIYEKDNKLNINFENTVDGEPDLQIGKEGDKTEVLIDGQSGGGSNAPLICTDTEETLDKTYAEIEAAFLSGTNVIIQRTETAKGGIISMQNLSVIAVVEFSGTETYFNIYSYMVNNSVIYTCEAKSEYPHIIGDL